MKYLGLNLMKYDQNLYTGKHKMLMKKIKNLNKWGKYIMLTEWKTTNAKMFILPMWI